jgi:hypothetical protein
MSALDQPSEMAARRSAGPDQLIDDRRNLGACPGN